MIIFINIKSNKFCQIALRIKRFIHERKVVSFFLPHRATLGHSKYPASVHSFNFTIMQSSQRMPKLNTRIVAHMFLNT